MLVFICEFIQGCAICQLVKANMNPMDIPLQPNKVPIRSFQIMTTNFITDLPECQRYNAIAIYVNRGYKMVYIAPTTKVVDSLGSNLIFMHYIFPHTRLMEQLISDRGPQFASTTTKELMKKLGIRSMFSTAYHPQTNRQTESFNQELEQYLRIFYNQ